MTTSIRQNSFFAYTPSSGADTKSSGASTKSSRFVIDTSTTPRRVFYLIRQAAIGLRVLTVARVARDALNAGRAYLAGSGLAKALMFPALRSSGQIMGGLTVAGALIDAVLIKKDQTSKRGFAAWAESALGIAAFACQINRFLQPRNLSEITKSRIAVGVHGLGVAAALINVARCVEIALRNLPKIYSKVSNSISNAASVADDARATAASHRDATAASHRDATAAVQSDATAASNRDATAAGQSDGTAASQNDATAASAETQDSENSGN